MSFPTAHAAYSPKTTAEPFLVIEENRFAHAAIEQLKCAVARRQPRLAYVSGPSGVGKSHLAGHLARELRQLKPAPKVVHITADGFADELVSASDGESIPEFQQSYAGADVLICEDLQGLRRRGEAQRKLIAILDEVLATGGRVLLTCRYLPGELGPMEPRLVSRCRGGVSAAIRLPGRDSRENLVRHFAATRQVPIAPDVAWLLAGAGAASPRELLATVMRLDAESRLLGKPIDAAFATAWLAREAEAPGIALQEVARCVARHFGVSVRAIRSGTRQQGPLFPRQCAMYLARELTRKPLSHIAVYFGRKNHSTVTHACQRVRELLADEPGLRQQIVRIRQTLGAPEE
ncbi:MAG: DnaA/Hda family protein [Planctomycetales bacterium]